MGWERELERLKSPLCPDVIGNLPLYAKRLEAIRAKHKQLKIMERSLKSGKNKADADGEEALTTVRNEISELLSEAYAMPCHGCPVQKPCSKQTERERQLEKRIKEFDRRIQKETTRYWRTFVALADILRLKGYLDGDKPTKFGQMAASIRGTNELFLCEVAINGPLDHLTVPQFSAMMTALVTEEGRLHDPIRARVSPEAELAFEAVGQLGRQLFRTQRDFDVDVPISISPTFSGLTEMWAHGATWEQMRLATTYDEGDVVRALRRTVDLCRQFMRAPNVPERFLELSMQAERLLARDEVKEDF
jgi:superfamily II RNA helicase